MRYEKKWPMDIKIAWLKHLKERYERRLEYLIKKASESDDKNKLPDLLDECQPWKESIDWTILDKKGLKAPEVNRIWDDVHEILPDKVLYCNRSTVSYSNFAPRFNDHHFYVFKDCDGYSCDCDEIGKTFRHVVWRADLENWVKGIQYFPELLYCCKFKEDFPGRDEYHKLSYFNKVWDAGSKED